MFAQRSKLALCPVRQQPHTQLRAARRTLLDIAAVVLLNRVLRPSRSRTERPSTRPPENRSRAPGTMTAQDRYVAHAFALTRRARVSFPVNDRKNARNETGATAEGVHFQPEPAAAHLGGGEYGDSCLARVLITRSVSPVSACVVDNP